MLELKQISIGYGKQDVLRDLSATFKQGCLTSVIGVNGCGKTTLLKAITGLLPLSGGEILLDGQPLSHMKRGEIARRIAYLPQERPIPDMTVEQLVLHGRFPYLSYPRHYRAADRLAAKEAMDALGIGSLADAPISTLSGGMRQTVYLAMALAGDADYLLLDEPTTYLDVCHSQELMGLLRRLADSGKGVVAVMHDLPLAFGFSHEILVLSQGQTVAQSSPEELYPSSVIAREFGVELGRVEDTGDYYCRKRSV